MLVTGSGCVVFRVLKYYHIVILQQLTYIEDTKGLKTR